MRKHYEKLLSICIPTYNREEYLYKSLDHLCEQLVGFEDEIELLIANNGSSDNSFAIIEEFRNSFPTLDWKILTVETNIGADAIFLKCFNLSRGKYFWLIGDDDIVLDGVIDFVMQSLNDNINCASIYLGYYSYFGKDHLLEYPKKAKTAIVKVETGLKFIELISHRITFISANILNREFVDGAVVNDELFLKTNLLQLSWVMQCVLKGKEFIVNKKPCIAAKGHNNIGTYDIIEVFSENVQKIFKYFRESNYFSINKIARLINRDLLLDVVICDLLFRKNRPFKSTLRITKKQLDGELLFYYIVIPVVFLPNYFARVYLFVLRKIRVTLRS